eukprot:1195570-Prorocentrum_minimum.AAC.7
MGLVRQLFRWFNQPFKPSVKEIKRYRTDRRVSCTKEAEDRTSSSGRVAKQGPNGRIEPITRTSSRSFCVSRVIGCAQKSTLRSGWFTASGTGSVPGKEEVGAQGGRGVQCQAELLTPTCIFSRWTNQTQEAKCAHRFILKMDHSSAPCKGLEYYGTQVDRVYREAVTP